MLDHGVLGRGWGSPLTGPELSKKNEEDRPDHSKGYDKLLRIDKRATPIGSESRWSLRLGTELCSRSHLGKGLYDSLEGIHVDDKLQFVEEHIEIMEREIKRLKRSRIPLVMVCWNSRQGPEFTWEREDSFKQKYPHLFTNRASSSATRGLFTQVNKARDTYGESNDVLWISTPLITRWGFQTKTSLLLGSWEKGVCCDSSLRNNGESFQTKNTCRGLCYYWEKGLVEDLYGIRDTWVDSAEAVLEIAHMTVGEVNTRVVELVELHERDTQDLYALLEDAQDRVSIDGGGGSLCFPRGLGLLDRAHQTQLQLQSTLIQTQHQAELLALREQQRRARQPGPEARIPDHQDASRTATTKQWHPQPEEDQTLSQRHQPNNMTLEFRPSKIDQALLAELHQWGWKPQFARR
ncbi:hypothetical protein Tco_0121146 [Tanacetum coccineum]